MVTHDGDRRSALLVRKLPPETVRAVCRVLLAVLLADCILSALFRTPILY